MLTKENKIMIYEDKEFKLAKSHEFKKDSANQSFTMSPSRRINLKGLNIKKINKNKL